MFRRQKRIFKSSAIGGLFLMASLFSGHANGFPAEGKGIRWQQMDADSSVSYVKVHESEDIRRIPPDMFGFNGKTIGKASFRDENFRAAVKRLFPGHLRYPGGTIGNYFDWHTGNFIPGTGKYLSKIPMLLDDYLQGMPENTTLIYMVNMARPVPETGIPVDTTEDVLKSEATLRKKIADILEAIDSMKTLGKFPHRIELGNEFYFHNDAAAIYAADPQLYLNHAAQLARAIRQKYPRTMYPGLQIALIASKGGTPDRQKWNQTVFDALKTDSQLAADVDAVVMHWYINSNYGPATDPQDATECMQLIAQPAQYVRDQSKNDYQSVPDNVVLWASEYGTKNTYTAGRHTWADGMRALAMAMNYFGLGSKIQVLSLQFIRLEDVINDNNVVGPEGYALALLDRAALGKNHAVSLVFEPDPAFMENFPALLGWKFWNDSVSDVVIANFSDKTVDTLDLSEMAAENDSLFLIQRYSTKPWIKGVNENIGIVEVEKKMKTSAVSLPPFSVTLLRLKHAPLMLKNYQVEKTKWFRLFQNYPNPFYQKTTLAYKLSQPQQVQVSVMDNRGKVLKIIENVRKPVGIYRIAFHAGNLPAGVYFYSLTAGNFSTVRKMILLKN